MMRERKPPTHKLQIEIPINIHSLDDINYDAMRQALQLALAVSQAAVDGVVCDDIQVTMVDVPRG